VGEGIAARLGDAGTPVTIVEVDPGRAAQLVARGFTVTTGDAGTAETLEAAGGLRADLLLACTGRDDENLVISLVARHRLEIPHVVAWMNEDCHRWLFDEAWGIDAAVSAASSLLHLIEETTEPDQTNRLAQLPGVGLVLVEAVISATSGARGHLIADLPLAHGDLAAAVVRRGRPMPTDAAGHLRTGDRVLVLTKPDGEVRVHRAFSPDGPGVPDGPGHPTDARGAVGGAQAGTAGPHRTEGGGGA